MVIRSLITAALFATAASASAGPTTSAPPALLGGWTLSAGSVSVVGALESIDAIVASGNWEAFTNAWNMHTALGNGAAKGATAVLFSPNGKGATQSVFAAIPGSPVMLDGASSGGGAGSVGSGGGTGGTGTGTGIGTGIGGGDAAADGSGSGAVDLGGSTLPVNAGAGADVGGDVAAGPVGNLITPQLVAEVPEPGSIALLLAGLAGAGFVKRRRSL